ncbi:MAG: hypothetical protein ICV68_08505 [Pyrinomonadaceae bacterium]|nr:hypothetical protein [Pyrinomonadaceae bacterium]
MGRLMNSSDDEREQKDFDDENLAVPAGPVRVVVGLMMMAGGFIVGALSDKSWVKEAGFTVFLVSFFVMLKSPNRKDEN